MTQTPLIAMIVIGIGLAFVFATIANRLKISPIAGYLMAGVAVGPFTPGFIADPGLALQLADIGVILLMFGVGLHFSLKDLLSLRKAVIPAVMAHDRHIHGPWCQHRLVHRLSLRRGIGFWPCSVGCEHGRAVARAAEPPAPRHRARSARHGLADRSGFHHGDRAGDDPGIRRPF